jgi:glycosyltransferase involved in cell wall biosynthesis
MMMKPEEPHTIKLSILTPVFNGAAYIEKCLQNVGSQITDEIEHLILDGLSTDGTVEMVKAYAANHPHVRIISEKDKGQSDAMNKGIKLAKGSVIGFLNVDDYYEPGVLPRIIPLFEGKKEPAFICGNLNIWNADGSFRHFNKPDRLRLEELVSNCFEWPYNPSAYFYHKSLHQLTGPYNKDNHYCMDYEFILESARLITLEHVDELWGNFFMAEGSKTQATNKKKADELFFVGKAIRDRYISNFTPAQKEGFTKVLEDNKPLHITPERKNERFLRQVKTLIKKFIPF